MSEYWSRPFLPCIRVDSWGLTGWSVFVHADGRREERYVRYWAARGARRRQVAGVVVQEGLTWRWYARWTVRGKESRHERRGECATDLEAMRAADEALVDFAGRREVVAQGLPMDLVLRVESMVFSGDWQRSNVEARVRGHVLSGGGDGAWVDETVRAALAAMGRLGEISQERRKVLEEKGEAAWQVVPKLVPSRPASPERARPGERWTEDWA